MKKPQFPWYEPQEKEDYINQQINILITSLLNRKAQFYLYRNMETMYVDGQVIDLFRKNDVLDYLKQVNLLPEAYARDIVELFRTRINPLYTVIPLSGIGTVNGIRQPRPKMTRFLGSAEVNWLQHVVESGVLTQTQGVL